MFSQSYTLVKEALRSVATTNPEAKKTLEILKQPNVFAQYGGRIFYSNFKLYSANEITNPDDYIEIIDDSNLYSVDSGVNLRYLRSFYNFTESDTQLESLYHQFSEDKYCAGWMMPTEDLVEEFLAYKETHTVPSL